MTQRSHAMPRVFGLHPQSRKCPFIPLAEPQMGDPEVDFSGSSRANGHYFASVRRAATVSVWGSCASWMRARFSCADFGISRFMERALQSTSCKKYWLPYFVKTTSPSLVDGSAG